MALVDPQGSESASCTMRRAAEADSTAGPFAGVIGALTFTCPLPIVQGAVCGEGGIRLGRRGASRTAFVFRSLSVALA